MRSRFAIVATCLPLALSLASCGSQHQGESADDYASKVGGPASALPSTAASAKEELPRPEADGRKAVAFAEPYAQIDTNTGAKRALKISQDGTFELTENGRVTRGTYTWLSDGKRLRLNGVSDRPIVLVAKGALYRLTNEDVPIDDLTPDRMYRARP